MPRRLISTDLDGTIVFNGAIPPRDQEAMARWRAAGNLLVVNTGRSLSAMGNVVVPMGLTFDYAVLYTGAVITDSRLQVLHYDALPPGATEGLLDLLEGKSDVTLFTTGLDGDLMLYDAIGSGSELLTLFTPATRSALEGREIIAIPIRFADEDLCRSTLAYLERHWAGRAVGFRNQDFVDVVPAGVSKGAGLKRLVATLEGRLAFERAPETGTDAGAEAEAIDTVESIETWSIGDSWNDITMHRDADHSYALPWSPPEVLAECDGTASSLAELIDSLLEPSSD